MERVARYHCGSLRLSSTANQRCPTCATVGRPAHATALSSTLARIFFQREGSPRSGRSIGCVKKNRNADTMLFMVGAGMPASRCSI